MQQPVSSISFVRNLKNAHNSRFAKPASFSIKRYKKSVIFAA
jgi:hypothetical protein